MSTKEHLDIPVGTLALVVSKLYYSVLSKRLEKLDIERYYAVLYCLYQNTSLTQQALCNRLAIDKTAMVKVMNYLIKAGYIVRRINPEDRREHLVLLTKKGRENTANIVEAFHSTDGLMFFDISKTERTIFLDTLQKVAFNLKKLPSVDLFFDYNKTSGKHKKAS